eukprot:gene93-698_t
MESNILCDSIFENYLLPTLQQVPKEDNYAYEDDFLPSSSRKSEEGLSITEEIEEDISIGSYAGSKDDDYFTTDQTVSQISAAGFQYREDIEDQEAFFPILSVKCIADMQQSSDPVNIVLVIAGSRGHRLLFRYPFQETCQRNDATGGIVLATGRNPFGLDRFRPDKKSDENQSSTILSNDKLFGYPDDLLANILTPTSSLCDMNFELKIDNALFIGHPTLIENSDENFRIKKETPPQTDLREDVLIKMLNIVLVMKTDCNQSVINKYQVICKILANALRHEEKRCRYLSKEREVMVSIQDEMSGMPEDCNPSPFQAILEKSKLAKDLKTVYNDICKSGIVNVKINSWINVSFCIPHKVQTNEEGQLQMEPKLFNSFANRTRPYHSILLLDEEKNLLKKLPIDCAPTLKRIIKMCSIMKSFQTLSQDADISLLQIFHVVSHLVYWGKAMIIYPLAESNVYVISKDAPTQLESKIAKKFKKDFPAKTVLDLLSTMARFSFPTTLGEFRNPLDAIHQQREHVQIVTWLLKQRLLKQLHTYVYILPSEDNNPDIGSLQDDELKMDEIAGPSITSSGNWQMLSKHEQRSIIKMKVTTDIEDIHFFLRLCPYFRGLHHLEEIMYYENIRRSELLTLIDKFRSILVTTQHEDLARVYAS